MHEHQQRYLTLTLQQKKTANMLLEQEAIEETPNTRQAIGSETAKLLLQQQACGKLEALQPFRVNQGRY